VPLSHIPQLSAETGEPPPDLSEARDKTAELQNRIHDLNQCNEVLLSRVLQLEEALERSQQALQQEVERSQQMSADEKVATAQNRSVAELLRDLEQSEAASKRQAILAETLTAQLQTYQARCEQLEQDQTVLRQQHAKATERLQLVESSCTDLRSRLQRQQRYTLQFKAALEKCLDTKAFHHTSSRIEADVVADQAPDRDFSSMNNPMGMPRSEQIQPWSANESATQTDPNLWSLMRLRSLNADAASVTADHRHSLSSDPVVPETLATEAMETQPEATSEATDSEAQQQLWQDVERVIDNTATSASLETIPAPETTSASDVNRSGGSPLEAEDDTAPTGTETSAFTEPIPWGAPISHDESTTAATSVQDHGATPSVPAPRSGSQEELSMPPTTLASVENEGTAPVNTAAHSQSVQSAQSDSPPSIPALDAAAQTSPSPIVHPLKPTQRKRKSLSAVELPSFPPLPKVNH
jgi:hypothetical protein